MPLSFPYTQCQKTWQKLDRILGGERYMKRILALAGALLLLLLYGATFFFALSGSPDADGWFKASLFCTVAVPVLIYGYILVYRYLKDRKK